MDEESISEVAAPVEIRKHPYVMMPMSEKKPKPSMNPKLIAVYYETIFDLS